MLVRAKTPRISLEIQGDQIPDSLLKAVRDVVSDEALEIIDGDDEYVNWFDSDLQREIEAQTTPGDVVRIYRENRGWTQKELGEKIGGASRQYVSDIEKNRRRLTAETAVKLSRVFGIRVDRFLRYESTVASDS